MERPYQMLQSTSFPDATSFRHLRLAVAGNPDPSAWGDASSSAPDSGSVPACPTS
jgi:hypothetical protein